uniref:Holliday junction recognition protein n=1 Tax=Canis lupus dingo TaxID=286419 RepID=A0A8C0LI21_CANLU
MEGQLRAEDRLLRQLRDSRCRFQRHMQQLIEKYNQPFEDAPLVQMSTLTYETPQGLRIWGGGLVKETNKGQIQVLDVKSYLPHALPSAQATARGRKLFPLRGTCAPASGPFMRESARREACETLCSQTLKEGL